MTLQQNAVCVSAGNMRYSARAVVPQSAHTLGHHIEKRAQHTRVERCNDVNERQTRHVVTDGTLRA